MSLTGSGNRVRARSFCAFAWRERAGTRERERGEYQTEREGEPTESCFGLVVQQKPNFTIAI